MSNLWMFVLPLFFLIACSPPSKEEGGKIMKFDDNPSMGEEEGKVENVEKIEKPLKVDSVQLLSAKIGLYQSPAVIILNWYPEDKNGNLPIDGYYFYNEHQKHLDLEGFYKPTTETIHLTESYKNEQTGKLYMPLKETQDEAYWAPMSDLSDHQTLNWDYITSGTENELELNIEHRHYTHEHIIQVYNGMDDWDTSSVTDNLYISILNDAYFSFDLDVLRRNAHMGHVYGIATMKGEKGLFLQEGDKFEYCEIEFDLSDSENIKVSETSCTPYHGANAYFDGTYSRVD